MTLGFNLGFFFAELDTVDDLTKQIKEVLGNSPKADYSMGFSKGYFYGRSRLNQKTRMDELNQIDKTKDRDLEVER